MGVKWFFTTRQGGYSQDGYASWNMGGHVGDEAERVAANRRLLCQSLGVAEEQLHWLNQVHGSVIHQAAARQSGLPPDGDGWVTRQAGAVLGIMVADCVPVLLADGEGRVVGAAHAGWQGALSGVLESCLAAMVALGAQPQRIQAIIGPCIHAAAYQVGGDLRQRFLEEDGTPSSEQCFTLDPKSAKFHFDLVAYVKLRLARWGVQRRVIHDVDLCTYANPDHFFSYRRTSHEIPAGHPPRCGRQLGGIFLL